MKKFFGLAVAMAATLLAACQEQRIENVEAEAENLSQRLEQRANEISAEAENRTNEAVLALENQTATLRDQNAPPAADANQVQAE